MSEDIKTFTKRIMDMTYDELKLKVMQLEQRNSDLLAENASLKARLWGQEPKEELVKCSACATISNWNKLTCGCPKCGNHSFYDVDKPKPQGEE